MEKHKILVTVCSIIAFGLCSIGGDCEPGNQNDDDQSEVESDALEESCVLTICSFNIQFLGHFKKKNDEALANILRDYDIVVVQELVAPPRDGVYPDGESYSTDTESAEFFDAMHALGFEDVLSEEDTGTNDEIHKKTSATEWWVTFFKPDKVEVAADLPSGFLVSDRSNHDDYERVPYAFAFRTPDSAMDFVLISVHLKPGGSGGEKNRRKHEITAITNWIDANNAVEKDFIILGDMNIEDEEELIDATPAGFLSLNDECHSTNTIAEDDENKGKPYDHVMYSTTHTSEIDEKFDLAAEEETPMLGPEDP